MDANAAVLALIDEIKAPGVNAKAFPEDPSKYVFADPVLVHLVRYQGCTAEPPVPNRQGVVTQQTRHEFAITTLYRSLTGAGGIYAHLETLRKALVGFTLPDVPLATVITTVRQGFLKEEGGVWQYESVFAMSCPESES